MIIIHVNCSLNKQYRESDKIVYQRLYSVNGENAEARAKRIKRSSAVKIDLSLERRHVWGQTPSTGLRHPSLEECSGKRCSECGMGSHSEKDVVNQCLEFGIIIIMNMV